MREAISLPELSPCPDSRPAASATMTPPGLSANCRHSDRTRVMSMVLWGMGLSYRDAARVRKGLGVPISHVEIIKNAATENAIGRGGKIKAKRMRGFKRADTILPIMFLPVSLGGVLAGVPFHTLLH